MDDKLFQWLAEVRGDPLAFVMGAFPWGESGTVLENSAGPEVGGWTADGTTLGPNYIKDIGVIA